MDISETRLLEKGEQFTLHEGCHIHNFEWLAFERLQDEYFYPLFLKSASSIFPNNLLLGQSMSN